MRFTSLQQLVTGITFLFIVRTVKTTGFRN